MKKTVVLLLLCLVFRLAAQTPKYIRIDTVYKPYFQFDYKAWIDTDSTHTHPLIPYEQRFQVPIITLMTDDTIYYNSDCFYGDVLQYNYFEEPTYVYGLAMYNVNTNWFYQICDRTEPIRQEYLYLYEAMTDTFQLMAQVPWSYSVLPLDEIDTFDSWYNFFHRCGTMFFDGKNPACRRDYYFDKPIHVQDSFYVGFSENYGQRNIDDPDSIIRGPETHYGFLSTSLTSVTGGTYSNSFYSPDSSCWIKNKMRLLWKPGLFEYFVPGTYEYYPYNMRPFEWVYKIVPEFALVLPIIKVYDTIWAVDTPACTPVWTFDLMSTYGNMVRLRWTHDGTHDEWQVSYGPHGTLPDDGTKVNCHTNTWSYEDTVGELMVAYVRTVCRELDTLRFSEWSEGVEWQVNVGIGSQGGGLTEVGLKPNPASEWVEVVSPGEVQRIEVYDAGGVKWREMPRSTAGFTVRDWAKGTYMVVIHTPSGSITKRLVVE